MQILFGLLIAAHGLITLGIGAGTIANPKGVPVLGTDWFPVALGQSWLLGGDAARIGGVLWIIAGVGLIATSVAVLGFGLPTSAWQTLGLVSAAVALLTLALYFHPYYLVGIVANLAILAAVIVFGSTAKSSLGI
jgi:hypothetical protein